MINLLADTFRPPELVIDLGTAATRVAHRFGGMRVQPSICAGRRALGGGVVIDPEAAVELLRPMLSSTSRFGRTRPRVVACTPTDVTPYEREIVADCVTRAGAGSVTFVPEPVAAAVGAGIDIGSGRSTFLVDVGEGVTDCAVIQRGRVVQSLTVRVGCGDLRKRLKQSAKHIAHLELSDAEAERLLRSVGVHASARGKDSCIGLRCGRVREERLSRRALHEALRPVLSEMLDTISALLRDLPANIAVEVIEDGIFLSGGGALLQGIREHVTRDTHVDVNVVANPLGAVVDGALAMLPFLGNELRQKRSICGR
ncbi:rod shape-determining protein [Verrucomicrobiota bacterium sgz303538]